MLLSLHEHHGTTQHRSTGRLDDVSCTRCWASCTVSTINQAVALVMRGGVGITDPGAVDPDIGLEVALISNLRLLQSHDAQQPQLYQKLRKFYSWGEATH